MATFSGIVADNQIIFVVWVATSGDPQGWENPKAYKALLDIGTV